MKIYFSFIILILLTYLCMTVVANTTALEKKSSKVKLYELVKRRMKEMIYQVASRAITSPNFKVIDALRMKLREFGTWIAHKDNENTFIGRCFGVARQIKMAMPLIMVKLGVIVTILVFLTIFSLKTIGLLLILFFFGASNLVAKFALWKENTSHQSYTPQIPQNVHFHIHPGKHGDYNLQGHSNPWDRSSSEELNSNSNPYMTETEFQDKLNLLSKYQQGLYNPYNTDLRPGHIRSFKKR